MKTPLISFFLLFALVAHAQTTDESQVMAPVRTLFLAMQKGDSAVVRKTFTPTVTLASIGRDKNGKPFIRYESSIADFLKAIGSPHPETYNEMIWGEKISIDGNFAQVWTSYAFYVGKKFSHCGVDAFHLVKGEDGDWRIFHLADTRQRDGCVIPPEISKQFQ